MKGGVIPRRLYVPLGVVIELPFLSSAVGVLVRGVTAGIAPTGLPSVVIRSPDRRVVPNEHILFILRLGNQLHAILCDETTIVRVLSKGFRLAQLQARVKSLL
jgi:hypothetical protein